MPFLRSGVISHFLRQHLPLPNSSVLPETSVLPESSVLPDPVVDVASAVGKEAFDLTMDQVRDAVEEHVEPDPEINPWLWDRDPFQPGIQLTSDPLTVDVSGILAATDVSLPDLPDDGLDAAFG